MAEKKVFSEQFGWAIRGSHMREIIELAAKGDDVNGRDRLGETVLHHLFRESGHFLEVLQLLLDLGVNEETILAPHQGPKADQNQTALSMAFDHPQCLHLLLSYIPKQSWSTHRCQNNKTLLHLCKDGATLKLLLEGGCTTIVNELDDAGRTALHYYSLHDYHELVQILIDHGADSTIVDNDAKTAKDIAQDRRYYKSLRVLLTAKTKRTKLNEISIHQKLSHEKQFETLNLKVWPTEFCISWIKAAGIHDENAIAQWRHDEINGEILASLAGPEELATILPSFRGVDRLKIWRSLTNIKRDERVLTKEEKLQKLEQEINALKKKLDELKNN